MGGTSSTPFDDDDDDDFFSEVVVVVVVVGSSSSTVLVGVLVLSCTVFYIPLHCSRRIVFPSQCENAAEAVPSAHHSCLTNHCPTHCSHASS